MSRFRAIAELVLILSLISTTAWAADPIRFYGATDNRARVIHSAYAYYPDKAELRVRLTLQNRQVKSARYRDPEVIRHLLVLLASNPGKALFCVYEGNDILSVYVEQPLGR